MNNKKYFFEIRTDGVFRSMLKRSKRGHPYGF